MIFCVHEIALKPWVQACDVERFATKMRAEFDPKSIIAPCGKPGICWRNCDGKSNCFQIDRFRWAEVISSIPSELEKNSKATETIRSTNVTWRFKLIMPAVCLFQCFSYVFGSCEGKVQCFRSDGDLVASGSKDRTKGSQGNLQEFSSQCRVQVQQFFNMLKLRWFQQKNPVFQMYLHRVFSSRLLRWGRYEDDLLHLIDKGIRECEDKVGSRSQCDNFSPVPFQSLAFWCFAAALQPVKPGCTGEAEVQWYLIFGSERCWNEHNEHWFLQQNICC